jgi:hypothetical protein
MQAWFPVVLALSAHAESKVREPLMTQSPTAKITKQSITVARRFTELF